MGVGLGLGLGFGVRVRVRVRVRVLRHGDVPGAVHVGERDAAGLQPAAALNAARRRRPLHSRTAEAVERGDVHLGRVRVRVRDGVRIRAKGLGLGLRVRVKGLGSR